MLLMEIEGAIEKLSSLIKKLENSREKSIVITKLEELELWMTKVKCD